MSAKLRWVLIIVGFLMANTLAMGFLVMASRTSRAEVIPDYYAKAARFDEKVDQACATEIRTGMQIVVRDAAKLLVRGVE